MKCVHRVTTLSAESCEELDLKLNDFLTDTSENRGSYAIHFSTCYHKSGVILYSALVEYDMYVRVE